MSGGVARHRELLSLRKVSDLQIFVLQDVNQHTNPLDGRNYAIYSTKNCQAAQSDNKTRKTITEQRSPKDYIIQF